MCKNDFIAILRIIMVYKDREEYGSSKSIAMERDLTVRASSIKMLREFLSWCSKCEEYLESLKKQCRKRQRTRVVNSLVAQIVDLESVRDPLYKHFVPVVGYAGYELKKKNYMLKEIETAF